MLGEEPESFSCYAAPTWCCCVKREGECWSVTLTLLAEIAGALSCLTMTGVAIFTACSHGVIVDWNLQADRMTL